MAINTKRVVRRELRFENESEILAEAERLAEGSPQVLGNWSAGQIFKHLAIVMDGSIDGLNFKAPWIIRLIVPLFKKPLLTSTMRPGFRLPKRAKEVLIPRDLISTQEGIQALRDAVRRLNSTIERKPSPVLGPMTREEWTQLHCRHAELHLSFLVL
jgi:hypothetical protein